ncbi:MAG: hypothetical protein ACK553_13845 [Planctomycetota bacterium]|jgi:hypothetical protein
MFTIISYLWILFILTVLILPIVIGLMSRPKRMKASASEPQVAGLDGDPSEAPVLDFGDELADMESKS